MMHEEQESKGKAYNRLWFLFELASASFCVLHCKNGGSASYHVANCLEMQRRLAKEKASWKT